MGVIAGRDVGALGVWLVPGGHRAGMKTHGHEVPVLRRQRATALLDESGLGKAAFKGD